MPNHKLKRSPDWRCRRLEYLRASGRNEDLIREGYETQRPEAKLVVIPGGRRRSFASVISWRCAVWATLHDQ